jgi:PPOX class probable F420-dependent enzyme
MDEDEARHRFAAGRVARLATVDGNGRPRVVPCCFVLEGDRVYSAVDEKPKRSPDLARLHDIAANPNVTLVVDHYEEDWDEVWWARVRGRARMAGDDEAERAKGLLRAKYPQYEDHQLARVTVVDVTEVRGWAARRAPG